MFGYLRAITVAGEKSERALNLTSHAINLNPLDPFIWSYRRQILKTIKYNLKKELHYVDFLIREFPKNHLAWHHRRTIANSCVNCCEFEIEVKLTDAVLEKDPKNYQAWMHRQWILNT